MSLRPLTIVALSLVLGSSAAAQAPKPGPQRLSPRDVQTIELIAQAYFRNETPAVLVTLSRLVGTGSEDKLALINQELIRRKVPDAGTLLAETRLAYVQQGLWRQLPRPGSREALILLRTLNEGVSATLAAKRDHPVMVDPLELPATQQGYEKALWNLHVLENQLATARLQADYMVRVAKAFPREEAGRLSDRERALIVADHRQFVKDVGEASRNVEEREVELRVARLQAALVRLEDPTLDVERFQAAYTAELDAHIVTDFLEKLAKGNRTVQSATLADSSTIESVRTNAKRVRELASDLPTKAALLYDGLHWWLRGRYGMGPDANGLAKSPVAAVTLLAQFGLFMPTEIPTPTSPDQGVKDPLPTFDRRHHYWWAWEDRRLQNGGVTSSTQSSTNQFTVTLSRFW